MKKIIFVCLLIMGLNVFAKSLKSDMSGLALYFRTGKSIDIGNDAAKFKAPEYIVQDHGTDNDVDWMKVKVNSDDNRIVEAFIQSDGLIVVYYTFISNLHTLYGESATWTHGDSEFWENKKMPFIHTDLHYYAREVYLILFKAYPSDEELFELADCSHVDYENLKVMYLKSQGGKLQFKLPNEMLTKIKAVFALSTVLGHAYAVRLFGIGGENQENKQATIDAYKNYSLLNGVNYAAQNNYYWDLTSGFKELTDTYGEFQITYGTGFKVMILYDE